MTDLVTLLGIVVSLVLTLLIFSFLFKPGRAFQIAEHLFVGTAVGISSALAINNILNIAVIPLHKDPSNIIPILLGLMLFTSFLGGFKALKRLTWLRQLPLALIVATGFSITVRTDVDASLWRQLVTVWSAFRTTNPWGLLDAFVILVTLVTSFSYFFYTRQQKGVLKPLTRVGRFSLMFFFGASFGSIVLARMTLIVGVVYNIIEAVRTLLQAAMGP